MDIGDSANDDAWRAVRDDSDVQFEPLTPPEPEPPPQWLQDVFAFLVDLFAPVAQGFAQISPALPWILAGVAALVLVAVVLRLHLRERLRRDRTPPDEMKPDRADALALLEDADTLAAKGQYGEAVRLLLTRSVGQISSKRPDLVDPSSTARELSSLAALPDRARQAFGTIARFVERNLFAQRDLSQDDWRQARSAYADFALEGME